MESIMNLISTYWGVVTSIIAVASAWAAISPSQVDNKIIAIVNKFADWAALNVFRAKDLRPEEEE